MTQITLPAAFVAFIDAKVKCDFKPKNDKWRANLIGSGAALATQLEKVQKKPEADGDLGERGCFFCVGACVCHWLFLATN